jgi:hypothetical protein
MFLATPHRGSAMADFPELLRRMASFACKLRGARLRDDLVQSLRKDAPELIDISNDFRNQHDGITIASFYEQKLVSTPYQTTTLV